MSGNVPYCPGLAGVKILTGYDFLNNNTGTINFSSAFTTPPAVFITMIISTHFSFTNCVTDVTNTSFSYKKMFNRSNSFAATEDFCWMAIGDAVESGNVPYCPADSGMNIQFGFSNTQTQNPTVTFSNAYSENAVIFMTMVQSGYTGFTCELWNTSNLKSSFIASKHVNGNATTSFEPFYWLAIGKSSLHTGNVPITSGNSGMKILTGYDQNKNHENTITFSSAFSTTPTVIMSIRQGTINATYMINMTAVSTTSFGYSKWYAGTTAASGEDFWWMAIGGA